MCPCNDIPVLVPVFSFDGNGRIVSSKGDRVPRKRLSVCIVAALIYHQTKKLRS